MPGATSGIWRSEAGRLCDWLTEDPDINVAMYPSGYKKQLQHVNMAVSRYYAVLSLVSTLSK